MKILYLSCHLILEYDEISLFTEMGHQVFSMGAYQSNNRGDGIMRGPIPNLYQDELLKQIALTGSKENIPQQLIDWADIIISMHNPDSSQPWIKNNWEKFTGKTVIWRSIGQSIKEVEQSLKPFKEKGLKIIRYSPFEKYIPEYCGEDAIIRFYKDENEYCDWIGNEKNVITFNQAIKARGDFCNYDVWKQTTNDLPKKLFGPGNEGTDGYAGTLTYQQQINEMRSNRVCLYMGTNPASYTLSFIECMMTGIPIVAVGNRWGNRVFSMNTYEVKSLIKNNVNGFCSDNIDELKKFINKLLDNYELAKIISLNARRKAIEMFGKDNIKRQWQSFFNML